MSVSALWSPVVALYVGDGALLSVGVIGARALLNRFGPRLSLSRSGVVLVYVWTLVALLGFKLVLLEGGPGVSVATVLSTGVFTRWFSHLAALLFVGFSLVGWLRVFRFLGGVRLARGLARLSSFGGTLVRSRRRSSVSGAPR